MIVVATNNGHLHLPELLSSIEEHGDGGHEVLVVDTQSSDVRAQAYFDSLCKYSGPLRLSATRTPYKGYDTGAYLYAFRNFPADRYIFMQDSLRVKHSGWTEAFDAKFTHGVGCVPWLVFPAQWDSDAQLEFVANCLGVRSAPPFGIFGPVFAAKRSALNEMDAKGLLAAIPSNKLEQQAMERAWPTAFFVAGYGVRPIHTNFSEADVRGDRYGVFVKKLPKRT